MPQRLHIVVFSAHIGDGEFTAGHLLAKYARKGHRASMVHLTSGEKGHPKLTPKVYEKQKRAEACASAKIWGCDVIFMPWRDGELEVSNANRWHIADLIRRLKPDIIATHWRESLHKDHVATHRLVTESLFYAALPSFKRKFPPHDCWQVFYLDNWEDAMNFHPNTFVDISDVYDLWHKGCMQHALFRGEVSKFNYRQYYEGLAMTRGALAGFQKAVALVGPVPIRKTKWLHYE